MLYPYVGTNVPERRGDPVAETTGFFIKRIIMIIMLKIIEWADVVIEFLVIIMIMTNGPVRTAKRR